MTVRPGLIDPELDVQGRDTINNARDLADEAAERGLQDGSQATGNGTTDGITAPVSNVQTATVAGASFAASMIGKFVTVASATNPANNGTFLVTAVPGATQISYVNSSGVVEANTSATFDVFAPYSAADNVDFTATDRKNIKGTASHTTDVPTYVRPSAIGTNVPANLTNIAGNTLDAKAKVIDVKQAGIKLRPSITDGDLTLAIGDETAEFTGYHFTSDDLNSFITISGSTDADGTYRIKAVTDGNTLELDGLNSATAEGTITWVLEGDLKGYLSSRSYADAVDRRGIPIADSGAEDETVYEATFCDIVDPTSGGRPSEEDGDAIYGRSFGDEKDPNNTATNEGTRAFVQLITGTNNGSAVDSSLEPISGRSGSAASITGGNTNITGLTGMSDEDIGRWLTIWNLAADEAGHYQIATIVSATEVTVTRGSNFTADASGAVNWQVSRHPGTWDFYTPDRYRKDELSETADRTTLIGGIVSDAELTLDIAQIREYIGAADGDTTPDLDNTGNYFPFSDLSNPADTSLEETVNILNQEVGNRDYSAGALAAVSGLADGQTITASIEALALAISSSSVTRTIERLSAAIPKNTVHDLPAGVSYTVDATNNGLYMDVYWRKQLRDPGPNTVSSNDYEETSGNGGAGGVGQITPYELIKSGDSVNYFVRA